jgi:hypothetical protein
MKPAGGFGNPEDVDGPRSVHVSVNDGDPKKCWTAIAPVTAANQKLPMLVLIAAADAHARRSSLRLMLMLIAYEKATRTESFGDAGPNCTESGWATKEAFTKSLNTVGGWLDGSDRARLPQRASQR